MEVDLTMVATNCQGNGDNSLSTRDRKMMPLLTTGAVFLLNDIVPFLKLTLLIIGFVSPKFAADSVNMKKTGIPGLH